IETELSVHALQLKMPVGETATKYGARPEGAASKLNTYKDGMKIARMIFYFFRDIRPLLFFSMCALVLSLSSLGLAVPIVLHFLETGLVPRVPTAILSTGLMILACLSLFSGFILDSIRAARWEAKRSVYMSYAAPAYATAQGARQGRPR
ncbi:MAG: glycosyl transferase, partial [Gammaproteobacteria bacterium]|nr:glycosyl transferase [Gammaproteobacteria bacterium]